MFRDPQSWGPGAPRAFMLRDLCLEVPGPSRACPGPSRVRPGSSASSGGNLAQQLLPPGRPAGEEYQWLLVWAHYAVRTHFPTAVLGSERWHRTRPDTASI